MILAKTTENLVGITIERNPDYFYIAKDGYGNPESF